MPKQNAEHITGNKHVLNESIFPLSEIIHLVWTLAHASINLDTIVSQGNFSDFK